MTPDTMGTAEVIRANARSLPLADDSVDLVVTSPPYFALRSYTDDGAHYAGQIGDEATPAEFVDSLIEVTAECMRVLKPSGSIFVNLGDKYSGAQAQNFGGASRAGASADVWKRTDPKRTGIPNKSLCGIPWRYALRCIDDLGLILRAEVIWSKPNGLPESVTDRVRRSHEQWFHFVMKPQYYSAVDTIRECTGESDSRARSSKYRMGAGNGWAGLPLRGTGSSGATGEPCSLTALPTSCGWDPSRMACSSTTCAAIASASTLHTSNPSPCGKTCAEAPTLSPDRTQSRPIAGMGTNSTTQTLTSSLTGAECVACVCEQETAPDIGGTAPLGKLPGSVWTIPTEPLRVPDHLGVDHFAAFPTEWPKRIIRGWSPAGVCAACGEGLRPRTTKDGGRPVARAHRYLPGYSDPAGEGMRDQSYRIEGYECACQQWTHERIASARTDASTTRDRPTPPAAAVEPPPRSTKAATAIRPGVVLDPFGGTGTTAMVAKALGRHGISVDMSADYCRLAEWRTNDRDQLAKVLDIPKADQEPADAPSLFDLIDGGAA